MSNLFKADRKDLALAYWMLGVSVAHALRFFVFDDPVSRQVIAVSGVVVYGLAAIFASVDKSIHFAYLLAIIFPFVGLCAVFFAGSSSIDDWQLAVGVTQFAAVVYLVHVEIFVKS